MRIISQDGKLDMPYEICAVWCRGSVIMCDMCGDNTTKTVLATYSTEKKAEKSMEILREQYKKYVGASVNIYSCFQFPNDDEIEVET